MRRMSTTQTSKYLLYGSISTFCLTITFRVSTTSVLSLYSLLGHEMFPYSAKESAISICNDSLRDAMDTSYILVDVGGSPMGSTMLICSYSNYILGPSICDS